MMKRKFKVKKGVVWLCLLMLSLGCEEYLEDELLSETSADFLYNTPQGLEDAVVGLYNLDRKIYENNQLENSAIPLIPQAKSDLVLGRAGHIAFFARLGWGIDQTSFGTRRLDQYWQHYYRLIDRANAVIQSAENLESLEAESKNQIIAEAKAFRANSYFTLYRQFNNIFITTEPTTPDNAFDRPQDKSSEEDIFALINEDLDFAIANLEWTTEEFGRWTQAAVRHVKAKVAIWEEDFTGAASQTDAIIDNGNYSLVPDTNTVFEGDMNHSESLFVVQFADAEVGGGDFTQINFTLVPAYNRVPGAKLSIDNGGRGNGGLLMNDYLRNLLKEDPNDDRDNGTYYITAYKYNDEANLPPGKQVGDTIDLYDQFSEDESERQNYYQTINPACIKFLQEDAAPTEVGHISNIMVYRLAETYLIGAEAHMMLSNTAKAIDYLNAVRTRANTAPVTSIDIQAILEERARELAFEGQRFYILKRLGLLVEYLRDHAGNDNFWNIARERIEPYMVNWPIPTAEIELLGP
ncbi:MAG: RagB/SusD family nutrient uptake outer membrane protein, partial [Pricia sp.]